MQGPTEDPPSPAEVAMIADKADAAKQHERLRSDEREAEDHNEESRDMVLWNEECGSEIKAKLASCRRKYVKVN